MKHVRIMLDGIGSSREISIAKTKLEEACMWAAKHYDTVGGK